MEKKLPIIKNKLCDISETESNIYDWLDMISRYENITELDRETVDIMIDHIVVGRRIKGTKNYPVEIHWNF